MNKSVEINIEKLILFGFSPADRDKIGEALKSELARLVIENGMPSAVSTGNNISQIDGGTFQISANMQSYAIGNHIAKSIYEGMAK